MCVNSYVWAPLGLDCRHDVYWQGSHRWDALPYQTLGCITSPSSPHSGHRMDWWIHLARIHASISDAGVRICEICQCCTIGPEGIAAALHHQPPGINKSMTIWSVHMKWFEMKPVLACIWSRVIKRSNLQMTEWENCGINHTNMVEWGNCGICIHDLHMQEWCHDTHDRRKQLVAFAWYRKWCNARNSA